MFTDPLEVELAPSSNGNRRARPYRRHVDAMMQAWGEYEAMVQDGGEGWWIAHRQSAQRAVFRALHMQAGHYLRLLMLAAPYLALALTTRYRNPRLSDPELAHVLGISTECFSNPGREALRRVKAALEMLRAWLVYDRVQQGSYAAHSAV